MSNVGAPVANDLKQRVLEVIEQHRGRANAIKLKDITFAVGYPDTKNYQRKIQLIIEELILVDHKPIAASCSENKKKNIKMGHFIPATLAEAENYAKQLESRLIADNNRKTQFWKGVEALFGHGIQTEMFDS